MRGSSWPCSPPRPAERDRPAEGRPNRAAARPGECSRPPDALSQRLFAVETALPVLPIPEPWPRTVRTPAAARAALEALSLQGIGLFGSLSMMDLAEFEDLLGRLGEDLARWPAPQQEAAAILLRASEPAR